MHCNVGPTDLKIRVALGVTLLILGFIFQSYWFLLGWIPIATGLLEFCPLYSILGINTSAVKKKFWA